ncbi:sensor histidine kinase [Cohnella soli]|uniref:Sensor histidine kinase n=1 Tax=Cohnella soli TaxID=425005 RepID=A0ABW0HZU9_9BACL
MNPKRTLRFKLIVGFVTVTLPLVCLLLYSNYTGSNSVREQAVESNKSMINLYSGQIQTALATETNFLYDFAAYDADVLSLNKYELNSTDYTLTTVRIMNNLNKYHRFDSTADIQFTYSTVHHDLIHTKINRDTYAETIAVTHCIQDEIERSTSVSPSFNGWKTVSCGSEFGLIRLVDSGAGVYVGAWVVLDHLMVPLELIQLGREGFAAFANREGRLFPGSVDNGNFFNTPTIDVQARYQRFKGINDAYIAVNHPITMTDVTLVAFIPEERMLANLKLFRQLLSWLPLFVFVLLMLYLIYLNIIIIRPMHELLRGMRSLKRGDWTFRINGSGSKEFYTFIETFNDMANQIQQLNVNVYEEQLRTHKAELKHLQLQINPHFLLNSINVVYNLAQIKNFAIIQAMCLNLVKYFRFTTKTGQPFVTIAEELEHMDSYLRIQQLRFPGKITFDIEVDEDVEGTPIPPLIVQPFIENAVKYGFDFMDKPFHIVISAMRETDGKICRIRIMDNGSGFPSEVLEALQSGAYYDRNDDQHLGIWNCYHRLQLLYGSEARLAFCNGVEGGAVVEIAFPVEPPGSMNWTEKNNGET